MEMTLVVGCPKELLLNITEEAYPVITDSPTFSDI